jgi:hypothetical protein
MNADDEIDFIDALRGEADENPCNIETRVFPTDENRFREPEPHAGVDIDLAFANNVAREHFSRNKGGGFNNPEVARRASAKSHANMATLRGR